MEELLNKLIEKGWKPFGVKNKVFKVIKTKHNWWYFDGGFGNEICYSLRELVSKDSGLWQFVCENGMLNVNKKYEWEYWTKSYKRDGEEYTQEFSRWCEDYRIVESSLCDEDKLEKFLLDKIKSGED